MIPLDWNGTTYDLDLGNYTLGELDELERRAGKNWRQIFVDSSRLDPDAVKAAFWLTDRRADAALKWDGYQGPPMKVVMPSRGAIWDAVVEMGKHFQLPPGSTPETNGSDPSPSPADITPPTSAA